MLFGVGRHPLKMIILRRVVKLKCNCAVLPRSSEKSPVFPVAQLCLEFPYYAVSRVSSLPSSTPIIGFYVPQYCSFNYLDHDSRSQGTPRDSQGHRELCLVGPSLWPSQAAPSHRMRAHLSRQLQTQMNLLPTWDFRNSEMVTAYE